VRLVLRNDQDKYEIGENIRLAREAQGMSQDDLADLVGTSRKAVSRYETGTTEMGIVTFFQYAEALNSRPEGTSGMLPDPQAGDPQGQGGEAAGRRGEDSGAEAGGGDELLPEIGGLSDQNPPGAKGLSDRPLETFGQIV